MKYMTLVKAVEGKFGEPPPALYEAIMKLGEEASKAGVFVSMGGLKDTDAGAELTLKGGKIDVTDGPFAESKEVLGGWAVYDTRNKAEAIGWARKFLELHIRHMPGFECTVEVREVMVGTP